MTRPGEPAAQPRLYGELVELWPLVSPPEDYEEEVATFRARLQRHGVADGAPILHLGCGGGSIDWHLKRHYRVTGVDSSEGMLRHARRLNPDVEYVRGDMRDWRADRRFAAVLIHDAIGYMTTPAELRAAYRTAAAHLDPGGVLLALPEDVPERIAAHRGTVETHSAEGRTLTLIELVHDADPADTEYELVYVFVVREGDALRVEVDRHRHGVFPLQEFLDAVGEAGFDARAEAWELSTWLPDEAPLPLITGVLRSG